MQRRKVMDVVDTKVVEKGKERRRKESFGEWEEGGLGEGGVVSAVEFSEEGA